MTSTEQINDLIQGYTDLKGYYEDKRDEIEAAVAAALAAGPDFIRELHVDQVAGDDAAIGNAGAPLKTLQAAVDRIQDGSDVYIYIHGPYALTERVQMGSRNPYFAGATGDAALNVALNQSDPNAPRVPGFKGHHWSVGYFRFQDIAIHLPGGSTGFSWEGDRTVVSGFNDSSLFLNNVEITVGANCEFNLFSYEVFGSLGVRNVTAPAEMAGLWLRGAAAGTDPATITTLRTNLPSL